MKKFKKLNLKKTNIANINSVLKIKGGVTGPTNTGGPLNSLLDCPITENADESCHSTDVLGSLKRQECKC